MIAFYRFSTGYLNQCAISQSMCTALPAVNVVLCDCMCARDGIQVSTLYDLVAITKVIHNTAGWKSQQHCLFNCTLSFPASAWWPTAIRPDTLNFSASSHCSVPSPVFFTKSSGSGSRSHPHCDPVISALSDQSAHTNSCAHFKLLS